MNAISRFFLLLLSVLLLTACIDNVSLNPGGVDGVVFEKDGGIITSITINQNANLEGLRLVIHGEPGQADSFTFSAVSSNPSLLLSENIQITGDGKFRNVTLVLQPDMSGSTTIAGTVINNSTGETWSGSIELIVLASPDSVSPSYTLGPINASYFQEEDGSIAGQGTDGSDPGITRELKGTSATRRIAINYSYDDFLGIDSYKFYGVWETYLDVFHDNQLINVNISHGWSDVSFYVDNVLLLKTDAGSENTLYLDEGRHDVRVEFHNHWHTTDLNVSFNSPYPVENSSTMSGYLSELGLDANTKIIMASAYESNAFDLAVTVDLSANTGPVYLFLSSYSSVNWVINNPENVEIVGIAIDSYEPASNIQGHGDAAIVTLSDLGYAYDDPAPVESVIQQVTGRLPDFSYVGYGISTVVVPGLAN